MLENGFPGALPATLVQVLPKSSCTARWRKLAASTRTSALPLSDLRIYMPATPPKTRTNILNLNIGVLGHVDSGKTSLVKSLSTLLSTAALDKNPESRKARAHVSRDAGPHGRAETTRR